MNGIFSIAAMIAILLACGLAAGLADRQNFKIGWLLIALALVLADDLLLTNAYGLLPSLIPGNWNWQGKALALTGLLAVATHRSFGFERVGLTLRQRPGSIGICIAVATVYLLLFAALALALPNEPSRVEDFAFQATLPGIEEELFYRGLLLFALNEAFRGRGCDSSAWTGGGARSCHRLPSASLTPSASRTAVSASIR